MDWVFSPQARCRAGAGVWILVSACMGWMVSESRGHEDPPGVAIASNVDLQRLVDFAAARLQYAIEYDANALKSVVVELRLDVTIDNDRLWDLTNQLLATRGYTSIHLASDTVRDGLSTPDQVFSIVKMSEAAGLARIEPLGPLHSRAGYVSVWVQVRNRPMKDVVDAAKALISRSMGAVQEVSNQGTFILSDLRPRVEQILECARALDDVGEAGVVEFIEAKNSPAANLITQVSAAVGSINTMGARPMQGKLIATSDNSAMILVAPGNEISRWRELIARFDQVSSTETRTYAVVSFTLDEVARLVEQTAHDPGPRGSGDRWRIIPDTLAGLLIVTATPQEHEQIRLVVERLNALPVEVRRPVRAFPIRNRSVSDIVDVLTKMLEAGVLDAELISPTGTSANNGPSVVSSSDLQRTDRAIEAATTAPNLQATGSGNTRANRSTGKPAQGGGARLAALTLTADEGTNTLIAVGEPRKLAQLEELLRTLDVRQPQVMIEVLVVSLNDGDTMDLGVELEKIQINGDTVTTIASLFGLGAVGGAVTGKGFTGLILNPGDFRVLIRALQTLNNGRALNMPKVLVSNNQQANLDAVVQQPFVSTNASDTVATTSFGGFENAGTTISVKPQIAKGDHLVLEYSVSLSAFVGESSDPGVPPPRQQNNLQSVVTVPDGYTVVVGGIEIQSDANAVSQVPLLGSIPIIGEAFKNRSRSKSTSRFYVFIRPTVLRQEGFEDLKYLSTVAASDVQIDDGFPEVKPRIIR